MRYTPRSLLLGIGIILIAGVAWAAALAAGRSKVVPMLSSVEPAALQDDVVPNADGERFSVFIHRPDGPPSLDTGRTDDFGNPVTVSCSTCHSIRTPVPTTRSTAELDEFHQALTYQHGSLTCLSCHNPDNYDELKMADQSSLAYSDVMTLCGQCHGPQLRDYNHGAHGGMTGYWDLTRGPRQRNNCIDCHDPHAPAFPMMKPTFKPIDRFLTGHSNGDEGE